MSNEIIGAENVIGGTVEKKEKLWTLNFFLLWQGQLVSAFGDTIYSIALGFWILAVTGSTGLMGVLMAASVAPRLIISPFAGVIVDRTDRKQMLVWTDIIRGIIVTLVGIAAIFNKLQVWMVFFAGIVLGICGSFFSPAVRSTIPDIVPKSNLIKANSVFSMIHLGTQIVSNSVGGIIFSMLGAPIMFLFNGLSYLFSGIVEVFIKIPKLHGEIKRVRFFEDMKDGFIFAWKFRGLRAMVFIGSAMNFFANIAFVLLLPMFQKSQALGPIKYGIAMSILTGGMLFGMLFTSIVHIPYKNRFLILILSGVVSSVCGAAIPVFENFTLMLILLFIVGITFSIFNTFTMTSEQLTVPPNMRGKIFALTDAITQGLIPVGMALGGILAEFIPIKIIISVSFLGIFAVTVFFSFLKSFSKLVNFNPDKHKLEDII